MTSQNNESNGGAVENNDNVTIITKEHRGLEMFRFFFQIWNFMFIIFIYI